jgi:hypothetical protein
MSQRIVNLEVNDAGAWRRFTTFDLDTFEDGDLEHCAASLLELSSNEKIKARLIIPGDFVPLTVWTKQDGWREQGEAE